MSKADYIPDAIVADVLSWLPSKSLLRFKSVCKTWCSLISNTKFNDLHSKRASQNPKKIVFSTSLHIHLLDYESSSFYHSSILSDPLKSRFERYYRSVVGSSRGLVCFLAIPRECFQRCFFVWNPFTGDIRKIPHIQLCRLYRPNNYLHGFGYDSVSDDFILVLSRYKFSFHWFSLKSKCWNTFCYDPPCKSLLYRKILNIGFSTTLGTELNGVLHWILTPEINFENDPEIRICTFDLAKREVDRKSLEIPAVLSSSRTSGVVSLLEHKGCLCLYFSFPANSSKEIWMMKEYGDNKSWIHFLTLKDSRESLAYGFDFFNVPILCISSRNEIVLRDNEMFRRIRSNEDKSDEIRLDRYISNAALYVETLVSPNDINLEE